MDQEEKKMSESINESLDKVRKQNKPLMDRIKNGKRWLVENRLEVMKYNNMESQFNFQRWVDNLWKYWDLYNQAYLLHIVDTNQHDLFHPEWIEDLMPMLEKIFPKKRFKDALDS